jgi:hypothetical protein
VSPHRHERPGRELRTPEENRHADEQDARIRAVLDQAVHDGASRKTAISLGEPAAVVETWVNALWNGLRDGLSDDHKHPTLRVEDRLTAIVMLLEDRINAESGQLLHGLRGCRP